jgi:tetratricopeptide (TPR) repeat protein
MMETNPVEATKQLKELISKTNEVSALNMLAWQVVEMSMSDKDEVPKGLLDAAMIAAEKAVKLAPQDGMILDTLSHLIHINGNLDKAIELQKKAVAFAPEVPELKNFLKQLEKEKSEQSEKAGKSK